jgi:S-formylglutathione hydrolase FrmB
MRFRLALFSLLALAVLLPASAAAYPDCVERTKPIRLGLTELDRTRDGRAITLTLRSRALPGTTKVDVALPRGYDPSGRTRYPVLYWLHGSGSSYEDWIKTENGLAPMGDMPLIVVSPEGASDDAAGRRRNGSYMDWFGLEREDPGPAFAYESYHVRELIPFIDAHFPTRPTAGGRAVAGISMGGGGTRYAASFPGTFGYTGSFSGALARSPDSDNCIAPDPARIPIVWHDNSAIDLAGNMRGLRIFVRSGDGTPGPFDTEPIPSRQQTERAAFAAAQLFVGALRREGIGGFDAEFYPGTHHHPYWQRELPEFMAWLRAQLRRPVSTPREFEVENGRTDFTAWGWRFRAHRRVREEVYLRVKGGSVTATGSGKLDVLTPPRYRRGARYEVRIGGKPRLIRADRHGRLAFRIALGPSHTRQQTRFDDAARRGWRTVTARIGVRARASASERVAQQVVPLPGSITKVQFPNWTADGSRIIAAADSTEFAGTQLVTFAPDGSRLRCLTCAAWTGPPLLKVFPFGDGRRVLVRIGRQSAVAPADHGVVECAPSVSRCNRARVVPIVPPSAGDPNVIQDERELRIAPDGRHVALTQLRRTAGGSIVGLGVVGRLARGRAAYRVANARVVAVDGELKNFTPDGREVLFARFLGAFEAGNPDDVAVDLRSGRERRVTRALDWDEDVDQSPRRFRGRRWLVVGSARGTGLLETVSQVRRPTAIETGLSALPFAVFTAGTGGIAEPWVVPRDSDRLGQPLAPGAAAAGWNSRPNFSWNPNGTAVVFWQFATEDRDRTRVVVARLPERRGSARERVHPTPVARFAPRLAGYVPREPAVPAGRKGRVSGRMRVTSGPSARPGFERYIEVSYRHFADRRGFVIDGVERSYYDRPTLYGAPSLYSAALEVSGSHTGYLRATDVAISQGGIEGLIRSRVDGRRLVLGSPPVAAASACPGRVDPADFASAATIRRLNAVESRLGVRATANRNHRRFVDWLERRMMDVPGVRLRSAGYRIRRWDHRSTSLSVQGTPLPVAGPIPYTHPTGASGVTAPLVYLPPGEAITAANAAGRIVVRDRVPGGVKEDPDLEAAGAARAAGLLFVKDLPLRQIRGFYRPYRGIHWKVPGAYLGADEGQRIKDVLAPDTGARATLTLRASVTPADTRMLLARLPGRGKRRFVVESHTDGVNAIWDNGPIAMVAMARYLARLPRACRPPVEFAFTTGHLHQHLVSRSEAGGSAKQLAKQLDREYDRGLVGAVLALEHLGAYHYERVLRSDGPGAVLRRTREHEVLAISVTDSARLRAAVTRAVAGIAPTVVIPGVDAADPNRVPAHCSFGGEGGPYDQQLIPTVGAIAGPEVLFAPAFGMEAVDFAFMRRQSIAFTNLLLDLSRMPQPAIAGRIEEQRRQRRAGAPGCDTAAG